MNFEDNRKKALTTLADFRNTKALIDVYNCLCRQCKYKVFTAVAGKDKDNLDNDATNKMKSALNNLCNICQIKTQKILGGTGWT